MIASIFAIFVTSIASYFLIKRYQTHMVLLFAGMVILFFSILTGVSNILPKGATSTGFIFFDLFELLKVTSAKQLSGVGLIIMVAGGFAGYMNAIGASNALVKIAAEPLKKMSSPYLMLALAYVLGQIINMVVVSAAGTVMLLLVSFYPILTRIGVSKAAAAAVIATCTGLASGPLFGTQQLAARTAGLDGMMYFIDYQLLPSLFALMTIAVAHFFVQRYFDNKNDEVYEDANEVKNTFDRECPLWYAIFPFTPIILLFIFSKFGIPGIKLNSVTAMFMTWLCVVVIEMIRIHDIKQVFADAMVMFKKMAAMFAGIVSLVIIAQVFATSLRVSGLIDLILSSAQQGGLGATAMTGLLTFLVGIVTFLTGSGAGAFASFASLANDVHSAMGGEIGTMMVPMHLASSAFRAMSPVAGCVIAAAIAAGISPMAVVRRTFIPMSIGFVVLFCTNMLIN